MSIHLKNIDKEYDSNCKIHWVPCKIHFNGPTEVSENFNVIEPEDQDYLTASLRGNPLTGKTIKLPEGYKGVVFQEAKKPTFETAERKLLASKGFQEITYWNWDKPVSKSDPFVMACDWIKIANRLHEED